jgi:hypothetical protein
MFNATGSVLNSYGAGFYVDPVSNGTSGNVLYYNTSTKQITYGAAAETYGNANVASYLPTYTGNIAANIVKNGQTWTFGTSGSTTFPVELTLSAARGPGTVNFTSGIDKEFQIETQTASSSKLWRFVTNGNLYFPDNTTTTGNTVTLANTQGYKWNFNDPMIGSDTVTLYQNSLSSKNWGSWVLATNNEANGWYFDSDEKEFYPLLNGGTSGRLRFANATPGSNNDIELLSDVGNVFITADSTQTSPTWTFATDGNVTVPGSILAEFVTSPAPKITGFAINSTRVDVNGNVTAANFIGNIQGPSTVFGNLSVTGNLIVSGNTITVSTNNFVVSDNIIFMANNNPANILDIGFAAHYTTDALRHTGFVKDVNDGTWKLFSNVPQEITTTVDFTDAIYDPIRTGNITAPYFVGNGALLTGLAATYSNVNVASYLPTYSGNIAANIVKAGQTWTFESNGSLTVPGSIRNSDDSASIDLTLSSLRLNSNTGGSYVDIQVTDIFILPNNGSVVLGSSPLNWQFNANGNLTLPANNSIIAYPNGVSILSGITGGSSNYGNANVAAYLTTYGGPVNANVITGTANATINGLVVNASATIGTTLGVTGNITAGNIIANQFGNSVGTTATYTGNVTAGNLITSGTSGNITGANVISATTFVGNGSQLTGVATQVTGSWTLAAGANSVNINIATPGTFSMWVNGNIPNGIVTYTATVVITNSNVPVVGSQYGWFYEAGNALVLTSIPTQVVGNVGTISNASPAVSNAYVFNFGINNNSGTTQVVNWGYIKL